MTTAQNNVAISAEGSNPDQQLRRVHSNTVPQAATFSSSIFSLSAESALEKEAVTPRQGGLRAQVCTPAKPSATDPPSGLHWPTTPMSRAPLQQAPRFSVKPCCSSTGDAWSSVPVAAQHKLFLASFLRLFLRLLLNPAESLVFLFEVRLSSEVL